MSDKDLSWEAIYSYYYKRGLTMYILECLARIVTSLVIAISPILLFGCLNWSNIPTARTISEVILPFWSGWKEANLFFKLSFIFFSIYSLVLLFQFTSALPTFVSLHQYYTKKLGISDNDLLVIDWNEVVESIIVADPLRSISLLQIAQQVTREDNYYGAMVDDASVLTWRLPWKKEVEQIPMNNLFFYYLRLAMRGTIFDSKGEPQVCGVQNIQASQIQEKLKNKFRQVGILLILISPFSLLYEILYTVFHYVESIRASPGDLSMRRLMPVSKMKARDYNELPHAFEYRVSKSYEWANLFIENFQQGPLVPLMRMVSFIAGSIIAIVFFMGLITDIPHVLGLEIFSGKTVAWLLTILASVYAACKPQAPPTNMYGYGPDELISKLEDQIHLDLKDDKNSYHSWKTYDNVDSAYAPVWKHALMNVFGVILNPFLFTVILPNKSSSIVDFIRRNSTESHGIGWICALSTGEDSRFDASPEHRARVQRSLEQFQQMPKQPMREDSSELIRSIFESQQASPPVSPPTMDVVDPFPAASSTAHSTNSLPNNSIENPFAQTNQQMNHSTVQTRLDPNDQIDNDENLLGFGDTPLSPNDFFVPESDEPK